MVGNPYPASHCNSPSRPQPLDPDVRPCLAKEAVAAHGPLRPIQDQTRIASGARSRHEAVAPNPPAPAWPAIRNPLPD